tara:strand:+ start:275 stop:472 length:198 start_codon:yes stop_codon:yes gene_type:complete
MMLQARYFLKPTAEGAEVVERTIAIVQVEAVEELVKREPMVLSPEAQQQLLAACLLLRVRQRATV